MLLCGIGWVVTLLVLRHIRCLWHIRWILWLIIDIWGCWNLGLINFPIRVSSPSLILRWMLRLNHLEILSQPFQSKFNFSSNHKIYKPKSKSCSLIMLQPSYCQFNASTENYKYKKQELIWNVNMKIKSFKTMKFD